MYDIIFYIFAAVTLGGGYITATSKRLVYAAFGLLFAFFGVAGLYVMANADFLAVTQLMVYVGGILILLIFGIMLTNRVSQADVTMSGGTKVMTGLLSLGVFAILMMAFFGSGTEKSTKGTDGKVKTTSTWASYKTEPWSRSPYNKDVFNEVLAKPYGTPSEAKVKEGSYGTSSEIGTLMLTDFLMPFEIISVVILVALIGAAMIARKEPAPDEERIAESRG